MTDMIERIAKAIYEARNGHNCTIWAHLHRGHKDPYRADAKAAIEAMLEPDRTMIDYADKTVPADSDNLQCVDYYKAMVRRALSQNGESK